MIDILILLLGLGLILVGANALTDGASAVAKRFGISDLVIGLTIVAMGTSAPELVVSVTAALNDSAELALGNVVGSNIFNILAIVGCTAMVMPISVGKGLMSKELPLVILSSLVMWAVASDTLLDGEAANVVSRIDGILLLAFFAIFMRYTFSIAKADSPDTEEIKPMPMWKAALWIIGGLAGLIFGGRYFVDGASGIARSLGVSESVIGLTLVAAGTSLPELATSVVAALKKNPGIAIGNVIGSCLFNVFFIIGTAATISPLPLGGITQTDMLTLVGASVLLWFFGLVIGDRKITRVEGVFMLLCYIAYTAWLIINS
ncbi:MAG: calcium/sodium antiporter [Muribaculaceae bacterium]|nr:calcium/sodium antiporter [Muribaculaceae bacterium]